MDINRLFVILYYLSVLIMGLATYCIFTHEPSRLQKYALMVSFSLLIANVGYLIRVEGSTETTLIAGQKILYAASPFGMFFMILFILEYCDFKIPTYLEHIFATINGVIAMIIFSLDHHSLFYVSYKAVDYGGFFDLEKVYGPVHTITVANFALSMLAAFAIAVAYFIKNVQYKKQYVTRLMVAVMIPCSAYIVQKAFDMAHDVQPVAFAAFTIMVLWMIYKNGLYDIDGIASRYALTSIEDGIIVLDDKYSYKGCNEIARNLFPALGAAKLDSDIRQESSVIGEFADGQKIEYVTENKVYEVFVKNIDSSGRVVWLRDVTLQRRYTDLLKAQKQSLESEVVHLSDISYKDELTGIANRRAYEEKLSEIRSYHSIKDTIAVTLDINGLKNVNDTIGHIAGDELIKGAADIISKVFADCGDVYRTGGDEFYAIIEKENVDIEKLKANLKSEMNSWRGKIVDRISISYGFACGNDFPGHSVDQLMIESDREMYRYKNNYYMSRGIDRRGRYYSEPCQKSE